MSIVDWGKAYLTDNPFISTPPTPLEEVVWAGMQAHKEHIENRIRSSLETSPYALVLNWGPWGGGKTHAARYFSQQNVLAELSEQAGVPPPLCLTIDLPRGERDITKAIYTSIIGRIGLQKIGRLLSELADELGDEFAEIVRALVRDEEFAAALLILAGKKKPSHLKGIQLFDPDESVPHELKRYFLLNATASDVGKLELGRRIEGHGDMIEMLTAILNLLFYSSSKVKPRYSELILWFDEMEEIVSLPGKEQSVLTSLIRDFTDYLPSNLTMFINFTTRSGGLLEDIGAYLTPAVWSRVRSQIEFKDLTEDEILEYVRDLLNAPRFRPSPLAEKCPDESFPFDEDSIRLVARSLGTMATPRYVNETCSLAVERALRSGLLDQPGRRIDTNFLSAMEDELSYVTTKGRSLTN